MRIAICDDFQSDREALSVLIEKWSENSNKVVTIFHYSNGEDLVDGYQNGLTHEVIFLDIFMDRLSGIEAAFKIREVNQEVSIVFLTSTPEFAIEGYSVNADGYLLKPIKQYENKLFSLLNGLNDKWMRDITKSILIKKNASEGQRIRFSDILYIESLGKSIVVHKLSKTSFTCYAKLGDISEKLDKRFLYCNRSYIVNMDYIVGVKDNFVMHNGDVIPIKVRLRKEIKGEYFDYIQEKER
ncbi:LytR/AlgR family response regulator transcription factor [Anaerotignum sp. MB30-C6]|uniref:LytR/AlgR family response regulator transcription factor n=1 Tax=Anaerotignum sp. MB30-C6 TaxID=3070814 RepID=UPI0027DE364D|nr:LytTR family DNA-binding domain-containing protein [Anaerotignum sp. MB30-C6]WMI81981.1 LytTR family DNA-binding domain-containing protein [Anaerotignum sp. MB30-C6]